MPSVFGESAGSSAAPGGQVPARPAGDKERAQRRGKNGQLAQFL